MVALAAPFDKPSHSLHSFGGADEQVPDAERKARYCTVSLELESVGQDGGVQQDSATWVDVYTVSLGDDGGCSCMEPKVETGNEEGLAQESA